MHLSGEVPIEQNKFKVSYKNETWYFATL